MINKIIIMGRLTKDPESRQTVSGISSCRFDVAVNRPVKSKDGNYQADFIRCQAWRNTAEFISKYFSKGKMIIVEGALQNNDYTDQNGVKHYSMIVVVSNAAFGESKVNTSNQTQSTQHTAQGVQTMQAADADYGEPGDLSDFEEVLSDGEVPF